MVAIRFVLVRPQHPGNIGAAARALANFGWARLVLVDPQCPWPHPEAAQRAVGGRGVVERARVFPTLDAALRGVHFLIGTSRRVGKRRQTFLPLRELGTILTPQPPRAQIAVLFGSEEHGLHSDEVARCQAVMHIPTNRTVPSLNLAHAVALVAYEARQCGANAGTRRAVAGEARASRQQYEALFDHWESALAAIGYFPHGKPTQRMRVLRQLFDRAMATPTEIDFLRGIARQMEWAGKRRGE